jgi:type II secretory pathway pseudopilin PulG
MISKNSFLAKTFVILLLLIAISITGKIVYAQKAASTDSTTIWDSLPQDTLLVAHVRASDLVEFYNKNYAYMNNDLKTALDASIKSLEQETSLKFKDELLTGFNGQYTLSLIGDLSFLSQKPDKLSVIFKLLNDNLIVIVQPKYYQIFEKAVASLTARINKDKKTFDMRLPNVNETSSILIPGVLLPITFSIYRDKHNALFIGSEQSINRIKAVKLEKIPPLSALPEFKKSFQYFCSKGQIATQFMVNPAKLATIIQYFYDQSNHQNAQSKEFFTAFMHKMEQSSSFIIFQTRTYEDVILSESTMPEYFYDLYFWFFVANMGEGMNRGKQTKTLALMRNLNTLLEVYRAENDKYPPSNKTTARGNVADILKPALESVGNSTDIPVSDGWDHPLYYEKIDDNRYILTSYGRDGKPGNCAGKTTPASPDDDIILDSGQFTCLPSPTK